MDTEDELARDAWISDLYSDFANDVLAGKDDLYYHVIDSSCTSRMLKNSPLI